MTWRRSPRISTSAFHRQFKALTPLQYQKQLCLLEARRLMVSRAFNVEAAAFEVGYESLSQFSREYGRMFGAPPKRDIKHLQTIFRAEHPLKVEQLPSAALGKVRVIALHRARVELPGPTDSHVRIGDHFLPVSDPSDRTGNSE
jgi:AraC-like DNA-binding protein